MFQYKILSSNDKTIVYEIVENYLNGKRFATSKGEIEKQYFAKFLENRKREYLKKMFSNYVARKKVRQEVKKTPYTGKELKSLSDLIQANGIIQDCKTLKDVCLWVALLNDDIEALKEAYPNDFERVLFIQKFAAEHKVYLQ